MKLKTLKDFECLEESIIKEDDFYINSTKLKAEAVKKVKWMIENKYKDGVALLKGNKFDKMMWRLTESGYNEYGDGRWDNIIKFLMWDNNLTEEDLK